MGALERDNNIRYDEESVEVIDIGNYEASPMAVTSRCIYHLYYMEIDLVSYGKST